MTEIKPRNLLHEIRQGIAELTLISHAPTQNFDPIPRDTSDEPGGGRPGGSDRERRPSNATSDEIDAWAASYHRKTPDHFRREVQQALEGPAERHHEALTAILGDLDRVLEAWKRRPLALGGKAPAKADPEWKRYIAECGRDSGDLAREYGVHRSTINRIKAMDWSVRDTDADPKNVEKLTARRLARIVGDELRARQRAA